MTRSSRYALRSLIERGLLVAILLAVFAPVAADAGTFAAFGPREFFRDPSLGPTESEFFSETFAVVDPSLTYTLRVERVRANLVEVDINGTQVVARRDFVDAGSDIVEKSITIWDVNFLELEMQADPDGLVTITLFGPDDDSPTISAVVDPEPNDNGWNNTPVTISFDCDDPTSGISVCPASIFETEEVDGRVIQGQAVDLAGNTAETSVTVSIDLSLPTVNITSHNDGDMVNTPTVEIEGTVADSFAGIDTVTCNDDAALVGVGTFECVVDLYLGGNTVTVEATDLAGNVATDTVTLDFMPPDVVKQLVDDTAPTVIIDDPADGSTVAVSEVTALATISGRVLDLLQGFNQPRDVEVTLQVSASFNGSSVAVDTATAEVSNGTFSAADVTLRRGSNTITATATDAAGNVGTDTVIVDVQELSGQRIEEISGDNQSATVDTELTDDLVVKLIDLSGSGASGRNVTFKVSRGDGTVDGGSGAARSVTVATDASGNASVAFTVGERSGSGNHQVTATATGFAGSVVFTASATPGTAIAVKEASPTDRSGQPSTALPEPLVVFAHDAFGNPVPGTDVNFVVSIGDGQFTDATLNATRTAGDDGRALAFFVLGTDTDRNGNAVTAKLPDAVDPPDGSEPLPITFKLSPSDSNAATSLFGIVLDQNYEPLPGVSVTLFDTGIEGTSADCDFAGSLEGPMTTAGDGTFSFFTGFTDSRITVFVDGSAVGAGQLCLETIAYTNRATNLGPIFLPVLQTAQDVVPGIAISIDDLPGSSLTIAAGSVTGCPDPGPVTCDVSVTRLANDQLPALPPRGRMPAVAWTVQPLGVTFDPPAELTVPNTGDFKPGEVVDLWEFDHDLAQFVRSGTATVSDDGSSITSDEEAGIRRSGIGYVSSQPLEATWVFSCDDGNDCTCDNPEQGFFAAQLVDCTSLPGGLTLTPALDDGFSAGLCFHEPLDGPCEDGLYCTTKDGAQPPGDGVGIADACDGGGCRNGTKVEDVDPTNGSSLRLEIDLGDLAEIIKKLNDATDAVNDAPSTGFQCKKDGPTLIPNLTVKLRERCCESEEDIVNTYLYTPQIFASIGAKCGFVPVNIKGLLEIGGFIGVSINGKLQADFEDSLCSDDECFYILSALLEVEPFGELEIEVLGGAAGANAKLAYPASLSVSQTCTCKDALKNFVRDFAEPPDLDDLAGNIGKFPFAIDPNDNCGGATWKLCAGPLRLEGRIKLFGFIKIGFDVEFDGTTFCTPL